MAVRSMTGYGRAAKELHGREITVEIKSVNHRFFDFTARTPRGFGFLEERLKKRIGEQVKRGKVEVSVGVAAGPDAGGEVKMNFPLAKSMVCALRSLAEPLELRDDLSLSAVARFPDLFTVVKDAAEEDEVWQDVQCAAEEALERFDAMRREEGTRLEEDISGRLDTIEALVGQVEREAPQTVEKYRQRLYDKLRELLEDRNIEESRLLTEAALFADRVAVDEETVRLRSHIGQFREMAAEGGAQGRKMDFLMQEMNREANTIGSKAQNAPLARVVVEIKAELEKIREQIQNLE